jgi:hypothetical protein
MNKLSKAQGVYSGYKRFRGFQWTGTLIDSTSSGIITGKKDVEKQVGGELIARSGNSGEICRESEYGGPDTQGVKIAWLPPASP